MNFILTANTFKVPLMLSTRICAEKFRRQQNNAKKAKQVYLNTLAVSAVHIYLNNLGWLTSCEQSDSWNPIMQTLMDVADLEIPHYGKIECRAVLSEPGELIVPPEVQTDRIAYVFVKFSSLLKEGELLGFISNLETEKISLSQLQPIADFTSYLRKYKKLQESQQQQSVVELSKWWQGIFDDAWQLIEQVLPLDSEPTLSFRSANQLPAVSKVDQLAQGISRVKLLNLAIDHHNIAIALVLQLVAQDRNEIDISAKICPTNNSLYLPQGLEIMLLDKSQKPVLQAKANKTNETIEFLFSGEPGEIFSIQASFRDNKIVETFII